MIPDVKIPVKKIKCGFLLPVFGFGTWQMGGRETRNYENDDRADIAAIKTAIESGISHIDTAAWYAQGHTEELVGKAIKDFDRSGLIITTKVAPMDLHYDDIIKSAHASLERMGTDYIDIYVIHNPNPYIDISETMKAMDFLVSRQITRYIGLSNFNAQQFKQAQECSSNKISCNHLHYNLKHRGPLIDGTIKYCQENDVMIVAWRPVQKGLFSGQRFEILEKICRKYNKTPSQAAINWLISQDNIVTVSKTRNINHLKENISAVGWKMSEEDINLLMKNFPDITDAVENTTLARLVEPQ